MPEISLEKIREMVLNDHYENESFDFKEMLPDSRDESGKKRLRAACCSFANAAGGWIIFGVKDRSNTSGEGRLVGVNPEIDFLQQFGSFPRGVSPGVEWDAINPSPRLANGNYIHCIYIMKTRKSPHCLDLGNGNFVFYKRTNQGDQQMTYGEIQSAFIGDYERRIKLHLLLSELETVSQCCIDGQISDSDIANSHSIIPVSIEVINMIVPEVYLTIHDQPPLLQALNLVRQESRKLNMLTQATLPKLGLPLSNISDLTKSYNMQSNGIKSRIHIYAQLAITHLRPMLPVTK